MQIDPLLLPCKKLKSKYNKDFHIKQGTLKGREEKFGKSFKHMGTAENFLIRTTIPYLLRSKIDKVDFLKLQSSVKSKNTVIKTNQKPT